VQDVRKLHLKALRDLRALRLRALALLLMIAAPIGVYAGGFMARDSLRYTVDAIFHNLRLADLQVDFVPAAAEELPDLRAVPGVEATVRRYLTGTYVELDDKTSAAALVVYLEGSAPPGINDIDILAGHFISDADPNGVVIDQNFAAAHGLGIGDRLLMESLGAPRELRVVGIGVSPEFLILNANPNLLIPTKGSFAVLFAPMKILTDVLGYPLYNNLAFRYLPTGNPHQTEEAILARLSGRDATRITPRDQAFVYRFLA
jgi:putative ABC transport system permease protein